MRIARAALGHDVVFGLVDGLTADGERGPRATFEPIAGHPYQADPQPAGPAVPLSSVRLLAPVLPSKVIAVGKNYAAHAAEMGGAPPTQPMVFLKPSTSVIGPGAPILFPPMSTQVDYEAELAVVIGRLCKSVPPERVADVVLGYTCANDVTARDLQRTDGQWGRAKGFDTFCPLGPWIATGLDPNGADITCRVNGEVRQSASTADMVHPVAHLVSWISDVMTLLPGDVILTGTPAGIGPLHIGDEVSVTVAGIGTLTNEVVLRD